MREEGTSLLRFPPASHSLPSPPSPPVLAQALFLVSVRSCGRSRALRAPLRSRIPAAPAPCQRHRRDRRARTATERDGFFPLSSIISKFLVVPSRISHANARTRSRGSPGKEMRHCGMISISVSIKNAVWVLLLHPTPTPKSGLILLSPRLASHPLKKNRKLLLFQLCFLQTDLARSKASVIKHTVNSSQTKIL